ELLLVFRRLRDDKLSLKLANCTDRAAGVAPRVGRYGVGDQLDDLIDQFLAGRPLILLVVLPVSAGAAEEALASAAPTTAAAAESTTAARPADAPAHAAAAPAAVLVAQRRQVGCRRVGEVGNVDDEVTNIIDVRDLVIGQVFCRRDGDDAVVDRISQFGRAAAAHVLQDQVQRLE